MKSERNGHPFISYRPVRYTESEMAERAAAFYKLVDGRRSVRSFSDEPVPRSCIEQAIRAASTAPSGAHQQPWTFVAVESADIKRRIRIAAEDEEKTSYGGRMSEEWREALEPLGTDWQKPFLETVPWIVVVFAQNYGMTDEGKKRKHYYVKESVGLACGLFIAALHNMGLSTLTHTPSPMGFLSEILERPENEKPFILFPVGYAAADSVVPDIHRKPLDAISVWK